ncbi:APH(3') family aminoglycoside O-phosphotransferase [Spirosoma agri]|uniref:Aminoglycoside 3'-phosphotransferase n=1 Tax=Spirosoma agri TaxID=1987381 RepID=A0A6M0IIC6_9BACT|nr:APH(3') family aminoglycoside O-phosphotransferase [Spirosoma agri]NEU67988.1 aminoglycoside 3'-phosphotransferase [Spirosoma agri]
MWINTLPTALQRLIRFASWQPEGLGMSSAQTFRLDGPEPFYLKINAVEPWGGLNVEAEALTWLRAYLPAPEVVFYERMDETDYLLIRALPGQPASDDRWKTNPERLTETLAVTMRALHELDPRTCPFDQRTATKLRAVTSRVQHGLVDVDDFDETNSGQTPETILSRLVAEQPAQDDLVVTHGDFCLPNLILNDWTLSGFIDVGRLGVGDRYQDLALCIRDLTDELNTDQYNDTFFAAYGLPTIDDAKLRYFQLLDELN